MYPRGVKKNFFGRQRYGLKTVKRTLSHKPANKYVSRFTRHFYRRTLPIKQLDETKLDALSIVELEQLKNIIEEKQEEKRAQTHALTYFANLPTAPFGLNYTAESLGLRKYSGEARDPNHRIRDRFPRNHEKICLEKEELMTTDFLLRYKECLNSLNREQHQQLLGDRIFSLTNSPSLAFTLAVIEEACIYFKFHSIHNLPVDPQDLFMYTITIMRFEFFNKLNMAKLSCVFNDNGHGDIEYRIFRQLCGKPVYDRDMPNTEYEIQHQTPGSFQYPAQQALSFIITFARILRQIKERILQTKQPQFIREFDQDRVSEQYQCGMISRLVGDQFNNHECDDLSCQTRIQRMMSPWNPSLFFCTYFPKEAPEFHLHPNVPEDQQHLNFLCSAVPSCSFTPSSQLLPKNQPKIHLTGKMKQKKSNNTEKSNKLPKTKAEKDQKLKKDLKDPDLIDLETDANLQEDETRFVFIQNEDAMETVNFPKKNDSSLESENEMELDLDYEDGETCETDVNGSDSEDSE
ncbi:multifunctional expression regulator [macacine betaherpesvirus 9]|uniref:mRNA export factor ICP27 homolog n=1 Tax=macacine betaherpesvirus 9 TaxID=2560568 RepID=A0A191S3T4_9BETA|nr:multifunctional expression regulator [macacine betaherpesvirus 9]ANC96539.1 multifunctional expression regulator [macacine betaherpesvirus 9]